MGSLLRDIRYGVRTLLKNRAFTVTAILTLALGIGANTALFSVLDAMLLKKLPVKDADRLVMFNSASNKEFRGGPHNGSITIENGFVVRSSFPYQTFQRMREARGALTDVIAFGSLYLNVEAQGEADVAQGQAVSGNYFDVLGVPAYVGRTIHESDDTLSAPATAVLSHRYWTKRFSADRTIVGQQINLNNVAFTVVGVTPPGFEGTMQVGSSQDFYVPVSFESEVNRGTSKMKKSVWWLRLMGRLKPDATAEQARASLDNAFQQSALEQRAASEREAIAAGDPPFPQLEAKDYPHLTVFSGSRGEMVNRRYYRRPLYLLFGVVALVLVIACANVANLLLVRASARQKEIAVRLAMGASRRQLVRQLLTEHLLLALLGGGVGLLFALWLKDSLLTVSSWSAVELAGLNPTLDFRVLGFTLAVCVLTGLLFGLVPALKATAVDLTPALKDSGRGSSVASRSWLSRSLVVIQVSVSVLLLVGAGLLVRTLINLQRVDPGFNEKNLLLFNVNPGLIGYKDDRLVTFYQQMSRRLEAVPGVTDVTFSEVPLLAYSSDVESVFLPGAKQRENGTFISSGQAHVHKTRENFLTAMQTPLLTGRQLSAHDDAHAPRVAVVNQAFAKRYFPNANPIGQRFGFDSKTQSDIEIVGLAKDAKYTSQRDDIPPTVYVPWLQDLASMGQVTFEVRSTNDPNAAVSAVRQAVRDIDSKLPLTDVKTQVEQANEVLAMERLFAKLFSLFGLLAQQLASVGLYGVLAWSVSQRTQEIGIRMALGAGRGRMLAMILRQGMTLTLIGLGLGLTGAYVLTRYLESLNSMLFGVQPRDPLTFAAAAVLLTLVALVACFIPARRATKVDPLTALRYE